jgi:quercetin dioxygenase-like cupin family protein
MKRFMRGAAVATAAMAVAAGALLAQAQGFKRTEVQRGDLSVAGREGVQAVAEIQPGAQSGKHTHPGEEIGYILEGTVVVEIDGMAPKTYKAGEAFIVPNARPHNARNTSSGVSKVLGTYIVEKGKPLATPVP